LSEGVSGHIHQAKLNLTSTQSKQGLAKLLTTQNGHVNWSVIIEQLCVNTLDLLRQGEPAVDVGDDETIEPPSYLLYPIIPANRPVIIFGLGGTFKSTFALLCGLIVQRGWTDNSLGLKPDENPVNVLYLDWETDRSDISWQIQRLRRGMKLAPTKIKYRRCAASLADDLDATRDIVAKFNIGLVILDSAAAACGGDITTVEPVSRFFAAIRQIGATTLILAHTAKHSGENGKGRRTPYGSVFFENYVRSQWEIRREQEVGEDEIELGLIHTKVNGMKLQKPLGFVVTFGDDTITVRKRDPSQIAFIAEKMPTTIRILGLLRSFGRMSVTDLATELDAKEGAVRKALQRMEAKQEVVKVAGGYGLKADEPF